MCGRYVLYGAHALHAEYFAVEDWPQFADHYNIAPSLEVPVIRQSPQGKRVAHLLKWGLVPHHAKDSAIGSKLNNARAESVGDKPSFRSAWQRRRCLVPASGYYEWQSVAGERKQPWFIHLKSDEPLAMGGLWESWTSPEGDILRSFCVITTAPNEVMQPIHDRMPVIIAQENWAAWLDPKYADDAALKPLLMPYAAVQMEAWQVSRRVSNAREMEASLIDKMR
jgi:putative SOS response-associated peptidase YedK